MIHQMHKLRLRVLLVLLLWFLIGLRTEVQAAPPAQSGDEDFSIVVLPDTQKYARSFPATFVAQTQWIVTSKDALNIAYVAHEGDIVDAASDATQWANAVAAMVLLEDQTATGLADGIPYGILPGNHDQPTTNYNTYFGVSRFGGRGYYGGHYGYNNDNNYGLFSAGRMDFIVVNLQYGPTSAILDWAHGILQANSDRRAIVVSHDILDYGASFSAYGQAIYDALKDNSNLFLMLCGHNHTQGRRTDVCGGSTVYTLLADYQAESNGGNGWLRILEFSPTNDEIRVATYSPTLDNYQTDTESQFTLSYDMGDSEPDHLVSGFTAYNDCVYESSKNGQAIDPYGQSVYYVADHVTAYGVGDYYEGATSGRLLDQATGDATNVTVALTSNGDVTWQSDVSSNWYGGYDTASGTDARRTFGGIADMAGTIRGEGSGWWVDVTFTGLDPDVDYIFATSASRANAAYDDRSTLYTISGVDAATNASTSGVTVVDVADERSVAFNTGDNRSDGYVARWTGIKPGSDGSFKVRAEAYSSVEHRAYAFDVFMLQGVDPASTFRTLTFRNGEHDYIGAVDTFLLQNEPVTDHSALTRWEWDHDDPSGSGKDNFGLIRFDDIIGSGIGKIPAGSTILSATLMYYVSNTGDSANVNEVAVDWPTSVTFNTFGGDPGVQSDEYGDSLGSASGSSPGSHTLDVTDSLATWVMSPASNRGWVFRPTDSDGVEVRSTEVITVAQRPALAVTFTPPAGQDVRRYCPVILR